MNDVEKAEKLFDQIENALIGEQADAILEKLRPRPKRVPSEHLTYRAFVCPELQNLRRKLNEGTGTPARS